MNTLSFEETLDIHASLVADFCESRDPISPPGTRDDGALLQSAVSRQHVNYSGTYKYATALASAATLCYGICLNHAFHNGNKRTALVSMLCHLDKNNLTLNENVSQVDLYDLMLSIAAHTIVNKPKDVRHEPDEEVKAIEKWLRKNTRQVKKGERVITYRELRSILRNFNIEMENPDNNYISLVRYEEVSRGFIFKKKVREGKRIQVIAYPGEGKIVATSALKLIRKVCNLRQEDGVDSDMFYSARMPVDAFITKYKGTLKRLAKV